MDKKGKSKIKKLESYKDLVVWQKSVELVTLIYSVTENYPKSELYGLTSQTRRAAVSIPASIAEGSRKRSIKDNKRFLNMAFGSGAELETHIDIAKKLPFGSTLNFKGIDVLLNEVMKMLNKMTS